MAQVPYHEPQRGGNCRIHAVNTLFGRQFLTPGSLVEACSEFDVGYETHITAQFDAVQSDTLMLVSYIVEKYSDYRGLYIPIGRCNEVIRELGATSLEEAVDPETPGMFVFTPGHIFTVRYYEGEWWNLDSLKAPHKMGNLNKLVQNRNHGFVLMFQADGIQQQLIPLLKNRVCNYIQSNNLLSQVALQSWLESPLPDLLGDLEPALMALLRLTIQDRSSLMRHYRVVLKQYTHVVTTPELLVVHVLPLVLFAISGQQVVET